MSWVRARFFDLARVEASRAPRQGNWSAPAAVASVATPEQKAVIERFMSAGLSPREAARRLAVESGLSRRAANQLVHGVLEELVDAASREPADEARARFVEEIESSRCQAEQDGKLGAARQLLALRRAVERGVESAVVKVK